LQQRLARATNIEDLEILKRVEREKQEKKGTSYSAILRLVHWVTILAFLVGGVYALYLAGVRPCLTV
jgi:Ni,Fe-hydrogenase I cytochrome b subunit